MMEHRRFTAIAACTAVVVLSGCQSETYPMAPVEGVVLRAGQPLANVSVLFYPERESGTVGPRSIGVTDGSGRFRLQTEAGADGAVVGKHRVVVIDTEYLERTAPIPPNHPIALKHKGKPPPTKRVGDDYREYFQTPLRSEAYLPSSTVSLEVK